MGPIVTRNEGEKEGSSTSRSRMQMGKTGTGKGHVRTWGQHAGRLFGDSFSCLQN